MFQHVCKDVLWVVPPKRVLAVQMAAQVGRHMCPKSTHRLSQKCSYRCPTCVCVFRDIVSEHVYANLRKYACFLGPAHVHATRLCHAPAQIGPNTVPKSGLFMGTGCNTFLCARIWCKSPTSQVLDRDIGVSRHWRVMCTCMLF